jgi:hypothetical protein
MYMPDTKLESGNEFNLVRSEMWKNIWKILNKHDKEEIKKKFILLTVYAHCFFYKTILSKQQK